jgi:type I restriction enzyme S subunit
MTEGGDRDKLGRGCVWDGQVSPCIHQNHIFAVTVNPQILSNYYLEYLTVSDMDVCISTLQQSKQLTLPAPTRQK